MKVRFEITIPDIREEFYYGEARYVMDSHHFSLFETRHRAITYYIRKYVESDENLNSILIPEGEIIWIMLQL